MVIGFSRRALGIAALFSGAALLTTIVAGVSLPLALLLSSAIAGLGAWSIWARSSPGARIRLLATLRIGTLAGALATIAYDATKFALSLPEASRYNPFEVVNTFGQLLVGSSASPALISTAGWGFHLINGVTFGVAYCLLFGRRGVVAGIGWGLFIELFQLALFPGWLRIRAVGEFVRISAISHLVFGAVLGVLCQRGLRKLGGPA